MCGFCRYGPNPIGIIQVLQGGRLPKGDSGKVNLFAGSDIFNSHVVAGTFYKKCPDLKIIIFLKLFFFLCAETLTYKAIK